MMKFSKFATIIYIDHDTTLDIAKQTSLTITSIDKLNLRLVRAFDYLQHFNLNIRHKFDKQHIVLDVLSRLTFANIFVEKSFANDELNALFIAFLVKMELDFRVKIVDDYRIDLN